MSDKVETSTGTPDTFGWVRIPKLDTERGEAWERPDGKLCMLPKHGPKPLLHDLKRG
jgi:hypothetical protein